MTMIEMPDQNHKSVYAFYVLFLPGVFITIIKKYNSKLN